MSWDEEHGYVRQHCALCGWSGATDGVVPECGCWCEECAEPVSECGCGREERAE